MGIEVLAERKFFCDGCKKNAVLQDCVVTCDVCENGKRLENVTNMEPDFSDVLEKNGFTVVEGQWGRHRMISCKGSHSQQDFMDYFKKMDDRIIAISKRLKRQAKK